MACKNSDRGTGRWKKETIIILPVSCAFQAGLGYVSGARINVRGNGEGAAMVMDDFDPHLDMHRKSEGHQQREKAS